MRRRGGPNDERAQSKSRASAARATLNAITHPRIGQQIWGTLAELEAQGCAAAVVEAALMVETGSHRLYDHLIVVSADPKTQVQRVMARDGATHDAATKILATQLPMADKEAVADTVIRNDGDLDTLTAAVHAAWAALTAR